MVASAGLVGRSTELDELVGLVERARSNGAQLVVVEGEAGIGKSILADALADAAGRRGFRVLRAGADELGGRQSFGLIAGFLGARWLFEPADVLDTRDEEPALPAYGPRRPGVELQASEVAIAAIEVLCAEGPVAIVLEDLHWADPSSLVVLRRLLRHVASLPLALVGTMRPAPCPAELAKLVGDLGAPGRKVLGPLDDVAVETMARERVGAAPGPRLQAQLSLAGGNPLFVLELLETLGLEGALHQQAGTEGAAPVVEVKHTEIPPSLLLTIVRHLSFLPTDTLRMLSVAAVLGVGFSPTHLAAVTGRPIVELLVSLGDAMAAGLLREDGEDLSFRHELLREALYMDLPLGVRSAVHRDAARMLVRLGVPAGLLAEHALRGAERGDDDAVRLLHDAARQLVAEAPGTAVDLIGRAIEIARPISPLVPVLRADLAVALLWSGRAVEGEALCREALAQLADPARRATLRQCLVESLLARGQAEAVLAEVASGADDTSSDLVGGARLDAIAANALLFLGRLDEAATLAAQVEQVGIDAGDGEATVQALVVQALVAEGHGAVEVTMEVAGRAVAIAEADGTRQTHRRLPHLVQAMALVDLDHFDGAVGLLQRAVEVHESFSAQDAVALLRVGLGFARFWSGAWDEAEVELDTGLTLAEETDTGWRAAARGLRAVMALGRGETAVVERCQRLARAELAAGEAAYRVEWLDWATALGHEIVGEPAAAADALGHAMASWATGQVSPTMATVAPTAVRLAVARGATDVAGSVVTVLEQLAQNSPQCDGIAAAAAAARAQLTGDGDAMAAAALAYRRAARPLEQAMVAEQAALAFAAAGREDDARCQLAEAVAGYDRMGAITFARQATRRARAAGIAPAAGIAGAAVTGRRARFGWESLTPVEMQVLRSLAERRSNPEIARMLGVSRRTVETHVSHIFTKVGLRSRVTLAAEAAGHFGWRLRLEQLPE